MLRRVRERPEAVWGAVWQAHRPKRSARAAVCLAATIGMMLLLILALIFLRAPAIETPVLSTLIEAAPPEEEPKASVITPKSSKRVSYKPPIGLTMTKVTFTNENLCKGNWLTLSREAPLPSGARAPNTHSLSALSEGVVPVKDASVKTSEDCAAALTAFFTQAKRVGVDGLIVWRGALSPAEQRLWQLELFNQYALDMTLEEAAVRTLREIDDPNMSEHQLGVTVDIRMYSTKNGQLDPRAMDATPQGRYLLENMWKYGLVKRYGSHEQSEDKRYQIRYVGRAHATVMRELGLDFDEYLQLLREKGTLIYQEKDIPRYYIVSLPMEGDSVCFLLPDHCVIEASADNRGYAVAVCTLR